MATETSTVVYRALSLGAGVQSSVLALLLSQSDPRLIELGYSKPDAAIFADTGWEPEYVYLHLAWLEEQLDFPVIRVSSGDIRTNLRKGLTASGLARVSANPCIWRAISGCRRRMCRSRSSVSRTSFPCSSMKRRPPVSITRYRTDKYTARRHSTTRICPQTAQDRRLG